MSPSIPVLMRDVAYLLEEFTQEWERRTDAKWTSTTRWHPDSLRHYADRWELEDAANSQRSKRIEELAREMYGYVHPRCKWVDAPQYIQAATKMLDAYPALAEGGGDE